MNIRTLATLRTLSRHLKEILPFGLPLKLALGALLTVLGGAGFLGYISDYATYWYAIETGIRTPFESVPYLKAAVAFGSIFLLLTCGLIFAASVIFLRFLYFYLINTPKIALLLALILLRLAKRRKNIFSFIKRYAKLGTFETFKKMQARSVSKKIIAGLVFGLVLGIMCAKLNFLVPRMSSAFELTDSRWLYIGAIYGFTMHCIIVFPSARWPLSFLFTIIYFILAIYALFQVDLYSWFLRSVGHGGGIPIHVDAKDLRLQQRLNSDNLLLMLRTNDVYILKDEKLGIYLEVPRTETTSISYKAGAINYKR